MKKYTVKHLITSALLSLTALVVGYALLSLPFRLMDWLDPTQMKLVFATEFVLYITVLGLVNKLPVIGTVNRGLGWLTGGMTALLDLYLVLCVVWGLVVITGGNLNVLNDTVMHSSLYYKAFNMFNPFL